MRKIELTLCALSLVAITLNLLNSNGSGILTVLSLSSLACFYLYAGIPLFNSVTFKQIIKKEAKIPSKRIIGSMGAGLSICVILIGILFKIQLWPGAMINLYVGTFVAIAVGLIAFYKNTKKPQEFYSNLIKRLRVFVVIGVLFALIPSYSWLEIKYRNHPGYLIALKKVMNDQGNEQLQNELEIERKKMDQEE